MSNLRECMDCDAPVIVLESNTDEPAVCELCVEARRIAEKELHVGSGDPHGVGGRHVASERGLIGLPGPLVRK